MTGKAVLMMDRRYIEAAPGQTLLEAARNNGITIPTLCHLDGLQGAGSCRLCLVEVKGTSRLHPACLTKATQGMEVVTRSDRLTRLRRTILEMMLSERNHTCSVCVSNGRCELQDLAAQLGVTHLRLPYRYPRHVVDSSHDQFRIDHNRCVLCGRCVRVCDDVEGAHTWDFGGRGIETRLVTDYAQPWGEAASCTTCGKCVQVCPTGALSKKGTFVGETVRRRQFLPYLRRRREHWK